MRDIQDMQCRCTVSMWEVKAGAELDVIAEHIYGLKRDAGETDEALRKRCSDALNEIFLRPSQSGHIVGSAPNVQSIARPVTYGATCKRCNEHNPHAEYRENFVCYGCRH